MLKNTQKEAQMKDANVNTLRKQLCQFLTAAVEAGVISERERYIVEQRFALHGGNHQKPREIGAKLNVLGERVRQLLQSALLKLRCLPEFVRLLNLYLISVPYPKQRGGSPRWLNATGRIELWQLGNGENPEDAFSRQFELAHVAYKAQDFEGACSKLSAIITLAPSSIKALQATILLGSIYAETHQDVLAINTWEQAINTLKAPLERGLQPHLVAALVPCQEHLINDYSRLLARANGMNAKD